MNLSRNIALNLVPRPASRRKILFPDGNTIDIVSAIIFADKKAASFTTGLAPHLLGPSIIQTAKNIFDFELRNIEYCLDKLGTQDIKSPAQTLYDGYGDCKSFSVFTASILRNLGINYSYRLVSYSGVPVWTHVYIIAHDKGRDIIIDPVYKIFNEEKSFSFKKDYPMTKISYVSGIGRRPGLVKKSIQTIQKFNPKTRLNFKKHPTEMNCGEMDLHIASQRLEIEKEITEKVQGIGSLKSEHYQDAIDFVGDLMDVVQDDNTSDDDKIEELGMIEEDAENGEYRIAHEIAGIGEIGKKATARKEKKEAKKVARTEKKNEHARVKALPKAEKKAAKSAKRKEFVKKVATKVKKGLKAVAKVATAPQRLFLKGFLEVGLPVMAPLFLYTFVPDSAAANLPAKAQSKRIKFLKLKKFIVEGLGMKQDHFEGIVRNGITKRYKRSPESMVSMYVSGSVAGIGILPIAALIPPAIKIISKIVALFGKKDGVDLTADDAPDESDFNSTSIADKIKIKKSLREENPSPTQMDIEEGTANELNPTASGGGRKAGWC